MYINYAFAHLQKTISDKHKNCNVIIVCVSLKMLLMVIRKISEML